MKQNYFLIIALLLSVCAKAQIISFPDANLKARLLAATPTNNIAGSQFIAPVGLSDNPIAGSPIKIDANSDGEIQVSEAIAVKWLNLSTNIASTEGLQYFSNMEQIVLTGGILTSFTGWPSLKIINLVDGALTSINVGNCPVLDHLKVNGNALTSLNVNGCTALRILNFQDNDITVQPDTGQLITPNLRMYYAGNNPLSSFNIALLPSGLVYLYCQNANVNTLSLLNFPILRFVDCSSNPLTAIDISGAPQIFQIICNYTLLSTIDASMHNINITLTADHNPNLTYINLKNGCTNANFTGLTAGNPNLSYICVDESELQDVQSTFTNAGLNCLVSTYCSFVPGGTYYTIDGTIRFDSNNNGCNASDLAVPYMNLAISGASIGNNICGSNGNYSLPLTAGSYTLTPIFEEPSYFNVSPPNPTISVSSVFGSYTQDFCVTANGIHPDVEVVVIPVTSARPGFSSTYKIIYNNKGTVDASGSINFNFDDAVMNFTTANPLPDSQSVDNLDWLYADLKPFESRQITVTFLLNAPTATPPLIGGDQLALTATIVGSVSDASAIDNVCKLNQVVVNAVDPNDKTCLEGATIEPEQVGKYVHYLIRFENTGTAAAQNIVVKDLIDTNRFDIASLIPMDGSDDFYTRINGNKVEFIFENVNLPFYDANNDGYVMFKIKTKSTLLVDDTFSNAASIYFDYNFPIVTDPAVTTISFLQTNDFDFSDYFTIYPNPADDVLNIQSKNNIEMTGADIYNILGQLVIAVTNAKGISKIDVSNLTAGNYFIRIHSDKGTTNTKFAKK